jgi:LPXTG-motif cell wall-anchored protein
VIHEEINKNESKNETQPPSFGNETKTGKTIRAFDEVDTRDEKVEEKDNASLITVVGITVLFFILFLYWLKKKKSK